ncbi:MAG: DNA-processing protein DprA [Clostridia bacterium]|nr:DNA-processing protein DprA [Clostridia bacterium]
MSDILNWIWLSTKFPYASPFTDAVIEHFGYDADKIYSSDAEEYAKIKGLSPKYINALSDKSLDKAIKIFDWCTENNVGLLPYDSRFYPQRLRDTEKAPIMLYFKGRLINFDDNVCIAMVGTRRMTEYGKREGYRISRDLVLGGAVVVSGMAGGVDTVCHRGALDAGGYTVAVLGCGIDRAYPPENEYIMEEIAKSGLVITEYRPFTPPYGSNFPMRNRIISGLSLGTIVVEADARSGALITARLAEKQGRDIFSIPGNVGEMNSFGPNKLLKKGAKIVTGALDILEEYEYLYPHRIRIENLPAFMPKFNISRTPSHSEELGVRERKNAVNRDAHSRSVSAKSKSAKKAEESAAPERLPEIDLSSLSDTEREIYLLFPEEKPISADELSRSGRSVAEVLQTLTMLEIKGFVKAAPGGMFAKL